MSKDCFNLKLYQIQHFNIAVELGNHNSQVTKKLSHKFIEGKALNFMRGGRGDVRGSLETANHKINKEPNHYWQT